MTTRSGANGPAVPKVAVFGAGPGGLSVALELAERGFEVDVYERHDALGGKARGYRIPGTGTDGRADLPGEIGPHVPFGFYRTLPGTLRRIPTNDGRTAWENFVDPAAWGIIWEGETAGLASNPHGSYRDRLGAITRAPRSLIALSSRFTVRDMAIIGSKVAALVTGGRQRQWNQLEHATVADYLCIDELSPAARNVIEFVTAAGIGKVERMNVRILARVLVDSFGVMQGISPAFEGWFRLVAAPYDEAIFEPWGDQLQALGARIHRQHALVRLTTDGGEVSGAVVSDATGAEIDVEADWYVLALPPERAAEMTRPLISEAPALAGIGKIELTWLGGVGIYLNRMVPELHTAQICLAQPWKMAVVGYCSTWGSDFATRYGDGNVQDYVAIDIPDWDVPGVMYGKPARELTRSQIVDEVLEQLRREIPDGRRLLSESVVHSVHVSPSFLGADSEPPVNDEPLFVNTASSWQHQPDTVTGVANLFLAAAYVRTDGAHGLDSMDSAAEAGQRAANAILEASRSAAEPVQVATFTVPRVLKPLMALDDVLYRHGLPNLFDVVVPVAPNGVPSRILERIPFLQRRIRYAPAPDSTKPEPRNDVPGGGLKCVS